MNFARRQYEMLEIRETNKELNGKTGEHIKNLVKQGTAYRKVVKLLQVCKKIIEQAVNEFSRLKYVAGSPK